MLLQQARSVDASSPEPLQALASLRYEQGAADEALQLLRQSMSLWFKAHGSGEEESDSEDDGGGGDAMEEEASEVRMIWRGDGVVGCSRWGTSGQWVRCTGRDALGGGNGGGSQEVCATSTGWMELQRTGALVGGVQCRRRRMRYACAAA